MGAIAASETLLAVKWFARHPQERRRAVVPTEWLAGQRLRWGRALSQI